MDELCSPKEWARVHFGNADFADDRLNKRALIIAEKLIENPKPNIHQLFYNDKDAILAYRFMDNDKTDCLSVTMPHRNVVMQRILKLTQNAKDENSKKPMVLLLGDSSDVIFSYKRNIKNAGPIGKKNKGKGFILHPNLAVEWETKQILGVASVMDRVILDSNDARCTLRECAKNAPLLTEYMVEVTQQIVKNKKQPYRKAHIEVRTGSITYIPPQQSNGTGPLIQMNFVYLVEIPEKSVNKDGKPCEVIEPLQWLLLTDLPTSTLVEALAVRDIYRERWLIEEYFCCLKSGCHLEDSQLQEANRLKTITGFYIVQAVYLLELKRRQQLDFESLAAGQFPESWIRVLERRLERKTPILTLQDFYESVAMLGGWKKRRGGVPPGWKSLWRGWREMHLLALGYEISQQSPSHLPSSPPKQQKR